MSSAIERGFCDLDLEALRRRRSEKWRAFPPDVLPAFVAEMDFPLADPVADALHAAVARSDCGYAHPDGLAEAFAGFAARRHGWTVDPDRVVLVADVMAGVDHLLGLLTAPGDGVVINPPVYPPFFAHIEDAGRRVLEVPLAGDELDEEGLEQAFAGGARVFLLCHPHNPTGRVWSRAELLRVAELAGRHGVTVLADEIHAPLTLPGATHVPYLSLGEEVTGSAVAMTSASKAFNVPGLKCAVLIAGSAGMRRRLAALPEAVQFESGILGISASIAAWRDGDGWLDALLARLDANRRLVGRLLGEQLPAVGYRPPAASYLGWLDCRELGLGDDPRAVFLERGRVALARGLDFGRPGAGFARVTMGTSPALLTEIVARMAAAVRAD